MVNGLIAIFDNQWVPPTLNLAIVLNASTIHKRTLYFDFSIFAPHYIFWGHFFYKIGVYNLDLA
jgi:hypothetical protein